MKLMNIQKRGEILTFRPDVSCIFGLVSTGILVKYTSQLGIQLVYEITVVERKQKVGAKCFTSGDVRYQLDAN